MLAGIGFSEEQCYWPFPPSVLPPKKWGRTRLNKIILRRSLSIILLDNQVKIQFEFNWIRLMFWISDWKGHFSEGILVSHHLAALNCFLVRSNNRSSMEDMRLFWKNYDQHICDTIMSMKKLASSKLAIFASQWWWCHFERCISPSITDPTNGTIAGLNWWSGSPGYPPLT